VLCPGLRSCGELRELTPVLVCWVRSRPGRYGLFRRKRGSARRRLVAGGPRSSRCAALEAAYVMLPMPPLIFGQTTPHFGRQFRRDVGGVLGVSQMVSSSVVPVPAGDSYLRRPGRGSRGGHLRSSRCQVGTRLLRRCSCLFLYRRWLGARRRRRQTDARRKRRHS